MRSLIEGSPTRWATLRTWPTFSATSTKTTGRNIGTTDQVTVGVLKSGRPNQAASLDGL